MTSLVYTVTETLRYRGKVGQWAWVLHRIAGLGTLLFLVLHVIDTSWAAFYPELYAQAIREYQSPLFTVGEFALVGCVVYHAFNGLRVALLDWKPAWWVHQGRAMLYVVIATVVVLVPVYILMGRHVVNFYQGNEDIAGLDEVAGTMSRFVLGFVVIIGVALVLSALYGLIVRQGRGVRLPGRMEASLWTFMRLSGVLILPLVFGHLALMHVIQGVFDITGAELTVVGTEAVNESGRAVEFVGQRWDYLVAGVAVWRVYDGLLLALALIHGFNGLRYVVNDYARHPVVNRALNWATLFGMVALIVLGTAALLAGVDDAAYRIAEEVTFGDQ